jgi:hypothetical protein
MPGAHLERGEKSRRNGKEDGWYVGILYRDEIRCRGQDSIGVSKKKRIVHAVKTAGGGDRALVLNRMWGKEGDFSFQGTEE